MDKHTLKRTHAHMNSHKHTQTHTLNTQPQYTGPQTLTIQNTNKNTNKKKYKIWGIPVLYIHTSTPWCFIILRGGCGTLIIHFVSDCVLISPSLPMNLPQTPPNHPTHPPLIQKGSQLPTPTLPLHPHPTSTLSLSGGHACQGCIITKPSPIHGSPFYFALSMQGVHVHSVIPLCG